MVQHDFQDQFQQGFDSLTMLRLVFSVLSKSVLIAIATIKQGLKFPKTALGSGIRTAEG